MISAEFRRDQSKLYIATFFGLLRCIINGVSFSSGL